MPSPKNSLPLLVKILAARMLVVGTEKEVHYMNVLPMKSVTSEESLPEPNSDCTLCYK
jgi:hypothetical protein